MKKVRFFFLVLGLCFCTSYNLFAAAKQKFTFDKPYEKLSDSKATEETKSLFNYLQSVYGQNVLTGQMENAWNNDCNMLNRVYKATGKYPAMMGFDFLHYTGIGWNAENLQIERAINFWNGCDYDGNKISDNHGIVSFMWHWRDPCTKPNTTGGFYVGKEITETETTFKIPFDTTTKQWKTETAEYKCMMANMNTISSELLKLQEANVPVLWRPMHEAAGNLGKIPGGKAWFWWGAGNSSATMSDSDICGECFVALWKLMYKYFTEEKNLHNLIWVWNGQHEKFYPGDEYVDIIGDDIYGNPKNYSSHSADFNRFRKINSSKMVTLSECGNIPNMKKIEKDNSWWLYFMVWNDGVWDNSINGVSEASAKDNFWSGEHYNTNEHKFEVYNSKIAITLDELPDFTQN